jgi:hypothetical protein
MEILNSQRFVHNIGQRTSKKLFEPEIEEVAIFDSLAKNGPQILTSLAKDVEKLGKWETTRWAVKRRMKGTKNNLSLIEYEYVSKRQHDHRIRGKDGEWYCLTIKGFMASLSTEKIFIENSYLFKKYKHFISDLLDRKIQLIGQNTNIDTELRDDEKKYLKNICMQYIKNQIYIFLIWHEANEIGLRKRTNIYWYFVDFFENLHDFITLKFPNLIDEKRTREYKQIIREYFVVAKILQGIEYFTETDNIINKKTRERLQVNFQMMKPFVFEWYRYFDKLQMISPVSKPYDIKKIPSFLIYPPEYGLDIEYEGMSGHKKLIKPDMKEIVKSELSKILRKQDLSIGKIWQKNHDRKYQKDKFA